MYSSFRSAVALLAAAIALPPLGTAHAADAPPAVVTRVDVPRYLGTWHEIALIPHRFQRQCVADTTAEYALEPDGSLSVLNGCATAEGHRSTARGVARIEDAATNAKLRVTFLRPFGIPLYFLGGDYWIIGLDPGYRWAVVGHPKRSYGWILAREPELPPEQLQAAIGALRRAGYDTCTFETRPHTGAGADSHRRVAAALCPQPAR